MNQLLRMLRKKIIRKFRMGLEFLLIGGNLNIGNIIRRKLEKLKINSRNVTSVSLLSIYLNKILHKT